MLTSLPATGELRHAGPMDDQREKATPAPEPEPDVRVDDERIGGADVKVGQGGVGEPDIKPAEQEP